MSWSWRIGRIAGIDVYMHFTFLILLAWVALSHVLADGDVASAVRGVVFILALFGIIVLHELGHALAARRYGIPTRDITLLPIGGVARLERIPEDPKQELVVAIAGPLVNVVIAAAIYLGTQLGSGLGQMSDATRIGGGFLSQMFYVNIALVVFNLLPAFPMDGGRVLRALPALRMDYVRATQIAAGIGQAMAILFAFLGLVSNPFLLFIALFVWLGASQEASMVQMRSALTGIPVNRAMITDFRTLRADDPLSQAVEHLVAGFQQDFPVLEGEKLVGIMTRDDLAKGLAQLGAEGRVHEVMQRDFVTVGPRDMLQKRICHAARLQLSYAAGGARWPAARHHDVREPGGSPDDSGGPARGQPSPLESRRRSPAPITGSSDGAQQTVIRSRIRFRHSSGSSRNFAPSFPSSVKN